ncbi:MAG: mechanosensitive ion channel domain-containing protein [Candidatus Bathyarchaeia archaeon]
MAGLVSSVKRFALVIAILIVVAFGLVFAYDQLFAAQVHLTMLIHQTVRTVIIVSFGLIIILFIRRSETLLSKHVGIHLAAVFQFFMILVVGIVVFFASLGIFQVSPTTLLVGGGIASIVIGLVISTFVGNILAGTLVLMTRPFSIGDTVMVNNIPGKVEEITAMVTRIRNDIGGLVVIPNTAIVQGGVIVTTFPASEAIVRRRLPYSQGDRVYTTYMNEEGVVKELTPFYTRILLDSGKEITFLNSSVLTGMVAVARIN